MKEKPWCQGPKELLKHASEHIKSGRDFDVRIAFISIDNAIELMIKTYIELPERITGLKFLKKDREEAFENFHRLLNALENNVKGLLSKEEFGDIEYFHTLRNKLYHEGSGLTIDKEKVTAYLAIAELLYDKLFFSEKEKKEYKTLTEEFIFLWNDLEELILQIISVELGIKNPEIRQINTLVDRGLISNKTLIDIDELRQYRNKLIHGFTKVNAEDLEKQVKTMSKILADLSLYIVKSMNKT
jgi:uncharacterized protein YutE (UPF0331/DUF86 family)